jgi:hypothetical protein
MHMVGQIQVKRPSIQHTLSRDADSGYTDQKYPNVLQNANVYLTATGPQDFTLNRLKPVHTITNLRSTLILFCHVWIIDFRHCE